MIQENHVKYFQDGIQKRGTDNLDLDVFDVRPRQEPKTNQNQVQEISDRRRELRRHSPPLYNQGHYRQKSHNPNHVRTKRNADEHVVANVVRTQKGRRHLTMRNRSTMTSRPGG